MALNLQLITSFTKKESRLLFLQRNSSCSSPHVFPTQAASLLYMRPSYLRAGLEWKGKRNIVVSAVTIKGSLNSQANNDQQLQLLLSGFTEIWTWNLRRARYKISMDAISRRTTVTFKSSYAWHEPRREPASQHTVWNSGQEDSNKLCHISLRQEP